MSNIAFIWRKDDPEKARAGVAAMLGPAAETAFDGSSGAGVGAVAQFAGQRVFEDARVLVACDAELYNTAELCATAQVPPGNPAQIIAALYGRFGDEFPSRLRGSFSFVVFDRGNRRCLVAVDRFGINTLVYANAKNAFIVSSRIDAALRTGDIARDVDPFAIARYINYTVNLGPETILRGILRVMPGTCLTYEFGGTADVRTWWDMRYTAARRADEHPLAREMQDVVAESVNAHCPAGGEFNRAGAFLSGGTDSSTVAGLMSRLGHGPVKTFSIGFAEERFNELEYARITARHFRTDHHEYLVTADDCTDAMPRILTEFDEPFGNSSAIPTYFCACLAREHGVDTLLAGDGGDELFGGNERYATDRIFTIYHDIPGPIRKGLIEPALKLLPNAGLPGRAKRYVFRANQPGPERFFSFNPLVENPPETIFEDGFSAAMRARSVLDVPAQYYWNASAHSHLDRLLYVDVKITLGDNDLIKVTRMSELAGVRPRFPFLDASVAEFSGRIPAALKVKGFEKRYLFKMAFRDLLARETIAKKKHGFGIPVAFWMKRDKRMREMTRDILLSSRTYERGIVRRSYIEELFRMHENDETAFYGDTLWTFLALEVWFRRYWDERLTAAA